MKQAIGVLLGSLMIAFAPMALAQAPQDNVDFQLPTLERLAADNSHSQVAAKIAGKYVNLAGSEENALALVMALHEGSSVTLTAPDADVPDVTTIEPPTGKMGWSDVKFALVIAQDRLYRAGIMRPTGEQLQAALTGGDLRRRDGIVVSMKGVLQMRAAGMGWKQIASWGRNG